VHDPAKATLLYANTPLEPLWKPFAEISERCPTVFRWSDGSGQSRVRGNSHLKSTQAYPINFGLAVGRLFANIAGCSADGIAFHDLPNLDSCTSDSWGDADLDSVLNALETL
jgi:hypothetical protein